MSTYADRLTSRETVPARPNRRCTDPCHPCPGCCECGPVPFNDVARLRRWAWWLTGLTILWNCVEAVVATVSGWLAGSIALVGFGLDSIVEVSSALVIAWRLTRTGDEAAHERAERRAVRAIALTFFAIAAYVTYEAASRLLGAGDPPEHSSVGLAIVALSVVVMPSIAWAKRRLADRLGSVALRADAAETQLCAYLSVVVLVGLAANSLLGWWWMDPVAGLAVAALAIREGRAAWASGRLCGPEEPEDRSAPLVCSTICCPACPLPA